MGTLIHYEDFEIISKIHICYQKVLCPQQRSTEFNTTAKIGTAVSSELIYT